MKFNYKKNTAGLNYKTGINFYIPLFFILILIAGIDSAQSFLVYFKGSPSFLNFVRFFIAKLIYSFHFLLLAFIVSMISSKIKLNKKSAYKWIALHLSALIILLIIHQAVHMLVNYLIWNGAGNNSLYDFIFDNPVAWLDILVYVLFVLGYYLLEYRSINKEKEVKLSQLEVEFIRSKLNELRNKIHPQFLFNTLNSISEMIKKGKNKEANRVLSLLSDFLRITVYDNEREEVSLREELSFLYKYIEIEKIRFNKNIKVIKNINT